MIVHLLFSGWEPSLQASHYQVWESSVPANCREKSFASNRAGGQQRGWIEHVAHVFLLFSFFSHKHLMILFTKYFVDHSAFNEHYANTIICLDECCHIPRPMITPANMMSWSASSDVWRLLRSMTSIALPLLLCCSTFVMSRQPEQSTTELRWFTHLVLFFSFSICPHSPASFHWWKVCLFEGSVFFFVTEENLV